VLAGTFRTPAQEQCAISKTQAGALAYGAAHLMGKAKAGGLPGQFLLVVTPKGLHAFKYKMKRKGPEAKEEVAAWDRSGLKAVTERMQTTTRVTLEWPDGEQIVCDQDGMGDNPWADDVVSPGAGGRRHLSRPGHQARGFLRDLVDNERGLDPLDRIGRGCEVVLELT
jgi:hypothetical protein